MAKSVQRPSSSALSPTLSLLERRNVLRRTRRRIINGEPINERSDGFELNAYRQFRRTSPPGGVAVIEKVWGGPARSGALSIAGRRNGHLAGGGAGNVRLGRNTATRATADQFGAIIGELIKV